MTSMLRTRSRVFAVLAAAAVCLSLLWWVGNDRAAAAPAEGLACETSASNSFNLTSTSGYILTPDGNSIYMWGYAGSSGAFQMPGPTLCVPQGANVTITLKNLLREDVSISFPGLTGVKADGNLDQPVFDGTGKLTSLARPAAKNGGTVTYSFKANDPGTFLYRSGTDVAKQVQMGLYGALVVRPSDDGVTMIQGRAYQDSSSVFDPDHEYIHLLSEIDPAFHQAVERKRAISLPAFNSRYFLINGRAMPDTIAPNNVAWLPAQPYGAMVHIKPYNATSNPKPALIRYLNAGFGTYPFHPHGNDQTVIGRDGSPLVQGADPGASYEKFLIDVGPGQTVDTTLKWTDMEQWDPNTNPIPVDLPPLQDQLVSPDTWFSESPYLGHVGDLPAGVTNNNQCGEYYHVAHSHALQQATNYGATFGGMMTLIRIDPPQGCGVTP
jgi:FtsP/CotA-like multicopper oxidase with cupredoxin domain